MARDGRKVEVIESTCHWSGLTEDLALRLACSIVARISSISTSNRMIENREKDPLEETKQKKEKVTSRKKKKEQNSAPLYDLGTKTETTNDHHTEKKPLRKSTPIPRNREESIACCF